MHRFILVLATFVSLCSLSRLPAGEYNEVLSIGDAAPEWKALKGVDDKEHSLTDLKDKPVVVLVFTCNTCPVAADYEDRVAKFAQDHADKVAVVAINSNAVPDDRLDKMKERAQQKKFPFPYLSDDKQVTAKAYGAAFYAGILRVKSRPQNRLHGRDGRQQRLRRGKGQLSRGRCEGYA